MFLSRCNNRLLTLLRHYTIHRQSDRLRAYDIFMNYGPFTAYRSPAAKKRPPGGDRFQYSPYFWQYTYLTLPASIMSFAADS